MKHLPAIIAAAAAIALIAPAASAKTSVRQAQKACTTAVKALENVKTARASDDGQVFTNAYAEIPVRVRFEDGESARMVCKLDRDTGEVTDIETIE